MQFYKRKCLTILSGTILFFFIVGCGSQNGDTSLQRLSNDNYTFKTLTGQYDVSVEGDNGFEYLNVLRQSVGLSDFSFSSSLQKSAFAHALYLVKNNLYTHNENRSDDFFTGNTPLSRAVAKGYQNREVHENIYAGDVTPQISIDILLSNIYHRFAFLNPDSGEIGIGTAVSDTYQYQKVYTYEIGSTKKSTLRQRKNPKVLLWPYANQKDVLPVFYEESPDPLPECSVTGYPVSIEFNPLKNSDIIVKSFTLREESGSILKDVKILDSQSDPNRIFNKYQYVLFPMKRLDWGEVYEARIEYYTPEEGLLDKTWHFQMRALPEPNFTVTDTKHSFTIQSDTTAYFYLPPKDCDDLFKSYSYRYSQGIKVQEYMIDNNTIMVKATGKGAIKIVTDNGREFTVNVK